jgi:hypothetical protein
VLCSVALRFVVGALSAGLLALVFLTALIGEPSSGVNFAPTFVLVIFWLGLVPVQVLFGNVWSVLNPWLAVADAVAWIWRKLGQEWTPPLAYPERLGVWPGAFALFCFAALVAPFGEHDGRLVLRMPLSGLAGAERTPGMLAFIAVMLGSVGYDGLSRAPFWQNLRADLERPYIVDAPGTAELLSTGLALVGILGCIALVAGTHLGATWLAERMVQSDRPLAAEFLQGLVPIALVRPGLSARRRARCGARGRARPGRHDPAGA